MTEITINNQRVIKDIPNFYNNIHFHPTDAIEDDWGQAILKEFHKDNAVRFVRIYTMFEDMVTMDTDGNLLYDFSLNDVRMDTLVGYGFKLIVTYCFMPVCLSSKPDAKIEKYRYKGKGYNSYEPADYGSWKKLCADYTQHIVNRYGVEIVTQWYLECWNEPDAQYWMRDEPPEAKIESYLKLYKSFSEGIKSVDFRLRTGGPASCGGLPHSIRLVEEVVELTKTGVALDFISYHTYAISPDELNGGMDPDLMLNINKIKSVHDVLVKNNCGDIPIIIDEWEAVWGGPTGIDEVPRMSYRNSGYFAAAYAKMLDLCFNELILKDVRLEMIMLCLSGQHGLNTDFEGKRNFITRSGYKKPIYNAYVLTNRLGDQLLSCKVNGDNENLGIIPTKDDTGNFKLLVYYLNEDMDEETEAIEIRITFNERLAAHKYYVSVIDKENANAFEQWKYQPENMSMINSKSKIIPVGICTEDGSVLLKIKGNSVIMVEIIN